MPFSSLVGVSRRTHKGALVALADLFTDLLITWPSGPLADAGALMDERARSQPSDMLPRTSTSILGPLETVNCANKRID